MQATAKATYVRIAPRKVKIVLDLIRNKPADKAMAILKHYLLCLLIFINLFFNKVII